MLKRICAMILCLVIVFVFSNIALTVSATDNFSVSSFVSSSANEESTVDILDFEGNLVETIKVNVGDKIIMNSYLSFKDEYDSRINSIDFRVEYTSPMLVPNSPEDIKIWPISDATVTIGESGSAGYNAIECNATKARYNNAYCIDDDTTPFMTTELTVTEEGHGAIHNTILTMAKIYKSDTMEIVIMKGKIVDEREGFTYQTVKVAPVNHSLKFYDGPKISGNIGETKSSLFIMDSKEYTISELSFRSSKPTIADVDKVNIGEGQYISLENEKVATVYLKFIAEGTATIYAIAPDGSTATLVVNVIPKSYDDFNQNTYMVDKWVDEKLSYKECINQISSITDPSLDKINQLNASPSFLLSVIGWETANFFKNPVSIMGREIKQKEYYEAILLSLIKDRLTQNNAIEYISSSYVTNSLAITKKFTNYVKDHKEAEFLAKNNPLSSAEKEKLKEIIKGWKISKLSDDLEWIGNIIDYSKDIASFTETFSKYLSLMDIEESVILMLDEMYQNCDSDPLLRSAIKEVRDACNNEWGQLKAGVANGSIMLLNWTAKMLCNKLWEKVCESNEVTLILKAANDLGILLNNALFSTKETVDKYFSLLCLCNVRKLIKISTQNVKNRYLTDRTEENAEAYIGAVAFLYRSFCISCDYVVDFCRTGRESFVGNILYKDDESFDLLNRDMENAKAAARAAHEDFLLKHWCYWLKVDYPELFDEVAEKINLSVAGNLSNAYILLDTVRTDYTGYEIRPKATVSLNGTELKEHQDYTLTYSDNKEPGVATVIIKGIGSYEGTRSVTFIIKEKKFKSQINFFKRAVNLVTGKQKANAITTTGSSDDNRIESFDDLIISVTKDDSTCVLIENGVIRVNNLQIVDTESQLSILLPDDSYEVKVTSDAERTIDCSYVVFDDEYNELKHDAYNNLTINKQKALTNSINNGSCETKLDDDVLVPDYQLEESESLQKHSITVIDGLASVDEAVAGERVFLEATEKADYEFVKWEVTGGEANLINENSPQTSFVVKNSDVRISALYQEKVTGLLGDVDGDGAVTILDATYIQRKLAGLSADGYNEAVADTDGDGSVTILDATYIQRHLAGLSSNENIGKPV